MINVLHIRDTNKICGPGKTIMETAARIDKSKFNLIVGLFLSSTEDTNTYRDALKERGIQSVPLVSKSRFSYSLIKSTIDVVKTHNIHIIHSHEYKSDILTVIIGKLLKIPIITTAHGWINNSFKSSIYLWFGKNSFRFFDKVIAVSPLILEEVKSHGVANSKLILIYNAIVVENYSETNIQSGYLKKRFNIPEEKKIIGNIGRLSPEKGQTDFIHAAKILCDMRNDIVFVLTGGGPDLKKCKDLTINLGIDSKVFFTGHEEDVRPIFKDLDIFALTSYTEGFPNVVLESLSMNTPVLATDVGGTSAIVKNHETGVLIEPGNPELIASSLIHLLDNPEQSQQYTKSGQEVIKRNFEFSVRVRKIEALYTKVMEEF